MGMELRKAAGGNQIYKHFLFAKRDWEHRWIGVGQDLP